MALATQCPHCQTTFLVTHEQLALREGLVRCGACKEVFNGQEQLLPPIEPAAVSMEEVYLPEDNIAQPEIIEFEEPSFVVQGRRQQRIGRLLRVTMAFGAVILLIALMLQGTYAFRHTIAAQFPETKPLLVNACDIIGCHIDLPARIKLISIESSELQAISTDSDRFSLAVLLRNRSPTIQAWPNIELTLNDANEKTVARRIFTPHEYLGSLQEETRGFLPNTEQQVKLFFELLQLKASGYRVDVFYPASIVHAL
jgi:predicted Zn finger-like uncharacterized protein